MKSFLLAVVFLIAGLAGGYHLASAPDSVPAAALTRLRQQTLQSVGSQHSPVAAQHMYSRDNREAIDDVRKKTAVRALAPRTWLIRMPLVNAVLFDTGMAVARAAQQGR